MGRNPTTAQGNIYFQCRKKAAERDSRLNSREGAAELLGVSVSTLADYEMGKTKFIPVESVVRMSDLYGDPALKIQFCTNNCPIGACCGFHIPIEDQSIEQVALYMVRDTRKNNVQDAIDEIVDIACDGIIDKEEEKQLSELKKRFGGLLSGLVRLNLVVAAQH